jgi:hypothetical protein
MGLVGVCVARLMWQNQPGGGCVVNCCMVKPQYMAGSAAGVVFRMTIEKIVIISMYLCFLMVPNR